LQADKGVRLLSFSKQNTTPDTDSPGCHTLDCYYVRVDG
jgi:hypothetical protein